VLRAEQAVVGQAERLGQGLGVAGLPGLGHDRHHGRVAPVAVVLLAGQPGAQPQRQRRPVADQAEGMLLAGADERGVGGGPVLVHPYAAQPEGREGHRLAVAIPLRRRVGLVEQPPAAVQVTVDVERAFPRELLITCRHCRHGPRLAVRPCIPIDGSLRRDQTTGGALYVCALPQ
jgi:hypothetical protein